MDLSEVRDLIQATLPEAMINIDGEGCSFSVIVVTPAFEGLPLVRRQQQILQALQAPLATGALHAVTIKAHTPDEWQRKQAGSGQLAKS